MNKTVNQNIITPKNLMLPTQILNKLSEAARENKHLFLRIFNTRTNKNEFTLHKGNKFLFRDPKFIQVLNRREAIILLYKLNDTIKSKRYLDFELKPEGEEDESN